VRAGQLDLHPSLNPAGDMAKAYPLGASPLRERPLFAYFYLLERVPAPFSLGLRKRRNSRANEDPSPREALLLRSCQALVSIGGRYDTGHRWSSSVDPFVSWRVKVRKPTLQRAHSQVRLHFIYNGFIFFIGPCR